jgi:hypothetical protein
MFLNHFGLQVAEVFVHFHADQLASFAKLVTLYTL